MIEFNEWVNYCAFILLSIAGIISLVSIIKFKSFLIKLVILEVLTNLLMACIVLWALIYNRPVLIDACLTLTLIMFLGVVAYYQYLSGKESSNVNLYK